MEDFKKHIKPFGMLKKTPQKDPMAPKYIKPDGTQVIEQDTEYGKVVYEKCPDCTLISRSYDKSDNKILDYIRKRNLEIGHKYDEYGVMIYEFNALYDEHNKLAKKTEIEYEYHSNGVKSREISVVTPGEIKTETKYDENGLFVEKIEHRGSVKTFYDKNNKPFKREIDRGSGGIITEEF